MRPLPSSSRSCKTTFGIRSPSQKVGAAAAMAKLCFPGMVLHCLLLLLLASVQAVNCVLPEAPGTYARGPSVAGRLLSSRQLSTAPAEAPAPLLSPAQLLLELKGNISDPFGNLANWVNGQVTNPCDWTGVLCDQFLEVVHLNLSGRDLAGNLSASVGYISQLVTLDLSFNSFTGVLPESLGFLSKLQVLNITGNSFTGSIPASLSRCRELEHLVLQSNQFSGPIPSEIGQLSNLQNLQISNNNLAGSIPTSLGNCSNLLTLNLSVNALTGPIPLSLSNCSLLSVLELGRNGLTGPIPAELEGLSELKVLNLSKAELSGSIPSLLFNLTALQVVDLSENHLTGPIPKVLSAGNLTHLYISRNQLTGEIPMELGSLANLRELDFSKNLLTGNIPSSLAGCRNLEVLDLGTNQLQGSIPLELGYSLLHLKVLYLQLNNLSGTIPDSLQNCTGLVYFAVDRNIGLNGTIPSWIGQLENLTEVSFYNCTFEGGFPVMSRTPLLEKIYLDFNKLEGPIPGDVGNWWPNLVSFYANGNMLNGSIPASLGSCKKLEVLSLMSNRLSGVLPVELGNIASLAFLAVGANSLEGTIPKTYGNLTQLQRLTLRDNKLHGVIPDELSSCESLAYLDISGNSFSGQLPPWLGLLNKTLNRLLANNNQLSGGIPMELGYCSNLVELDLSFNELTGEIPLSLATLPNLQNQFDLSHNTLSGPIPPQLGSMEFVRVMDLSYNQLSGTIPRALSGCAGVQVLDLSHNDLAGEIPFGLGRSAGGSQWLTSVQVLNLSFNSLNGSIPEDLSSLQTLLVLDLSDNRLSGRIPESLANLSRLMFLNFSNNEFSGEVPTGGAFSGLTIESFFSNPGLCGQVLHKQCGSPPPIRIWVLVLLVLGVGAGALVGSWILFYWWYRHRQPQVKAPAVEAEDMLLFDSQFDLSVHDLWVATDGYSEGRIIGSGAVSVVYKGTLADGRLIAVKKIREEQTVGSMNARDTSGAKAVNLQSMKTSLLSGNEVSRSFVTELQLLGQLRHRNLVRLLGCHITTTGAVKAIVLEHLRRGNLEQALYGKELCSCRIDDQAHTCGKGRSPVSDACLSWTERLSIALDIVRGLVYLHFECAEPIIHCDLKPANILLDEDGVAHIGDFGIARVLAGDMTMSAVLASKVRGSLGYLAPEYALSLNVTTKGDVYSYGIILVELLTERRPTSHIRDGQADITIWAREVYARRNVKLLAPTLLESIESLEDMEEMFLLLKVAILCTETQPKARPTMREALVMLDNIKTSSQRRKESIVAPRSPVLSLEELAHAPRVWPAELDMEQAQANSSSDVPMLSNY